MTPWGTDAAALVDVIVPVTCIYREAANQGDAGMTGVAWVIANRMRLRHETAEQVCLDKWQFSSMNAPGDPGDTHYPITDADKDAFACAFRTWTGVINGTTPDPTGGATLYYSITIPAPSWASRASFTVQIGSQRFYRDA